MINPQMNWNINPIHNKKINPIYNAEINPQNNAEMNPEKNMFLNPMFRNELHPKSPDWKGSYLFDKNDELVGFVSKASQNVLLILKEDLGQRKKGWRRGADIAVQGRPMEVRT